jgi:competence protein ComEC
MSGALALGFCTELPSIALLQCLGVLSITMLAMQRLRMAGALLAGFVVMACAASAQLDDRLAEDLQGGRHGIVVRIDDFPVIDAETLRFTAVPVGRPDLPGRLRLSWFRPASYPAHGETWYLQVGLRRPYGYANPGGFDYEAWLLRQKIGATGFVDEAGHHYRIYGARVRFIDGLRARFVNQLAALLPPDDATAVLLAIAVGARHGVTERRWDQFAATGTSHLMAISGLHVGLAAGVFYVIGWLLAAVTGSRTPKDVAAAAALIAAAGYAGLTGLAVPARRALFMGVLAATAYGLRRRIRSADVLATCCLVLFLADPLTLLTPGFRLSFAAVAVIFYGVGHRWPIRQAPGHIARAGRAVLQLGFLQLLLLFGLVPLTLTEFGRISLLAFPVNLVILPLFNVLIVPFSLLGALLSQSAGSLSALLLGVAHRSIHWSLDIIDQASRFDLLTFANLPRDWTIATILPVLFVLLPVGWPGRRIVLLACLSILSGKPAPPPPGCFDYTVLDVGQGLSVVVRSHSHALLFDTGPAFRTGDNAARFTILPYLARQGITRLDRLVVSHADLDHAGGLRDVLRGVQVGKVLSGEPVGGLGDAQTACASGAKWAWDAVNFTVLHPRAGTPWTGNDASCVVEVAAGETRLLLPGDIESPAEMLLAYRRLLSPSMVVIVPHHGSRTSSSGSLVDATRPRFAIVSAAYRNRWGFPKDDVVGRWQDAGARVVNTATSGAVSQRLCRAGPGPLQEVRRATRRYWHDGPAR